MARVELRIEDATSRMTLRALVEREGHTVVHEHPEVILTDDIQHAPAFVRDAPTLVVTTASQAASAVAAMRRGVYGYILAPFVPGEAALMVRRAAEARVTVQVDPALTPPAPLAEVEARHIRAALQFCKNNQAKAARLLGIARNTLWRKLKQLEK